MRRSFRCLVRRRRDERLRRSPRSRCTRRSSAPRRTRRTSSAACGGRRRLRRPPATTRTPGSSRGSRRRAPAADRPEAAAEHHALQRVHERADGELGDEPHEVRRQAAVERAGAQRRLIAVERRGQQRPRFELAARRSPAGCASPPRPRRPSASASQSSSSVGVRSGHRQRNRLAGQRRHAARELGREVLRRQREPRQPAAASARRPGRSIRVSSSRWRARAGSRSGRASRMACQRCLAESSRISREKA